MLTASDSHWPRGQPHT